MGLALKHTRHNKCQQSSYGTASQSLSVHINPLTVFICTYERFTGIFWQMTDKTGTSYWGLTDTPRLTSSDGDDVNGWRGHWNVLNGMANLDPEDITAKNKKFLLDYNEPSSVPAVFSVESLTHSRDCPECRDLMCTPALSSYAGPTVENWMFRFWWHRPMKDVW